MTTLETAKKRFLAAHPLGKGGWTAQEYINDWEQELTPDELADRLNRETNLNLWGMLAKVVTVKPILENLREQIESFDLEMEEPEQILFGTWAETLAKALDLMQ